MQSEQLSEAALGVNSPWYLQETVLDTGARTLTIRVDFRSGSRFPCPEVPGEHPVHDTRIKRYRHVNFFEHECFLEVRVPRVKLPDGSMRLIEPPWAGKLSGFTLLFEALVLSLCREMPFAAVARLVGDSWHRVAAITEADYGEVRELDHVIALASHALDLTRRAEQKRDPELKGLRWVVLKNRGRLSDARRANLDTLLGNLTTKRTARAWRYQEDLREILNRKQINVMRELLKQWCTNVMRSKAEPIKAVARIIRNHLEGIAAWAWTRMTNGFLEASNSLFQAAKRKARRYHRLSTIRTLIFLIARKLDFRALSLHVT